MKAIINGIEVEATPEEIMKIIELNEKKERVKSYSSLQNTQHLR